MPRYSSTGKNLSAMVHASRSVTCVCGRTTFGNGGTSSHAKACLPSLENSLASRQRMAAWYRDHGYIDSYERALGDIERIEANVIRAKAKAAK